MKTTFAFWVSVALVGSFILAEQVPPAFEKAKGGPAAAAEDEFDPFDPVNSAPKLIRVQVEHIEMSHKDLTRLMMEDKWKTSDATALRMKVQEMVEKDQAKVIDTQIVVGTNGDSPETQSQQEVIHPSEFLPPELPSHVGKSVRGSSPFNPAVPSVFETRTPGSSLECEPTLGADNIIIDMPIRSAILWHTGNRVWSEIKDSLGNVYKIAMPDFYTIVTNTRVTCIPGKYIMVSALSPKDGEGRLDPERKVMVFVKCDVLPVVP